MAVDERIIQLFAEGNQEAFRVIFQLCYPRICAFVQGFVKDEEDSKDIVQLVFIKLWEKRTQFSEVRNFDAYLYTLTKYTMLNFISAKSIHPPMVEVTGQEVETGFSQQDELEAKDLRLLIDMVIEKLPPQRRAVFCLSRKEGLSNDEIALRLGIQKKTVENHLNLALKALKDVLSFPLILLMFWEL